MAADLTDELQLLLVEDNPGDARLIRHHLRSDTSDAFIAPSVTHVETLDAALERLETTTFDLVLLDLGLADSRGIETLERLNDRIGEDDDVSPLPVVVLTGLTDDETALEAIQQGAQDYLLKDHLEAKLLERAVRYALERHRQERILERQNERLERFASIVSHDLRNPLQVAQGRLTHVDPGDTAEHLDEAVDALDRMEELVDDLLDLARDGRDIDATESVDVADTARSAWSNVEAPASTLGVDVAGTATADAGRLTQLFENLFRNAVEHADDRSSVGVTVGALDDGFYVADDGPGIPESERDDVFEAGYTTNEDGTGFGLDIVREIVDAHGWSISITESETGGARFEITGLSPDDC
ncbi:hybrid sensor histidine kinase/response regulator [Haloplanus rubicundus]|uniref:histidine kinase n=1 Tax=Haloplanus rubicundus TaxID=1547898 RepID=A0A345EDR5_9EURY|nr:hybrid sensor histidine kinase/response regulator [Haloplanus rubicundus]AXG06967.1 hybrid sensor histidine kinase/response regulator [Haloplanus rubicundus]AXG10337.1 hybrid sensor histidine kinase/response regulator [Haloplanus rubicundus]